MHIRRITAPNPSPLTLDGTQTYLLGETAVLDPGPDLREHIDAILVAMPRLATILITHRHGDHAPAAIPLSRATGAKIVAPRDVLGDDNVAQRVRGGESLVIGDEMIEVIATPGHTNEHVCYFLRDGSLFTGDTILGSGTTAIFPPDGDMSDYLASLRMLRSRGPRRIYPAHGPIREDAVALIDEYIAHRLQREAQIVDALAVAGATIPQLRETIYPTLDVQLHRAAEIQLLAHLIKLRKEGRVNDAQGVYRLVS